MTNSNYSKLSTKEKNDLFQKIGGLKSEENWQAELELIELVLKDENTVTRDNRHLWYERAIALDMLQRPSESITILKTLVEIYPLHHNYAHSLCVTSSNLATRAIDLFKDDRLNSKIEIYVNLILENYYCPWELTELYLDHLILTKRAAKAKAIISDYLELSPFDSSFLEKALSIAEVTGDSKLLAKCLANVQLGLSFHPWNEELKDLLTRYFSVDSQEAV